ncbi:glycosyl transferase [Chlorella sorokiniana]|uniref:Hexosyltransferase n=1 Tax=Chlorella sorokiniana TaxID=3076 RepID=A0A2P6TQ71_CHLSO|nr:glycosyl transferase [Chlorella sorokiniana]|eukprot:PRW56181.1 glycosyl transferase [Chlorella sorokiniana]
MAPPCLQLTQAPLAAAMEGLQDDASSCTPAATVQRPPGCAVEELLLPTAATAPALPPLPAMALLHHSKPATCSLPYSSSSESITPHTPAGEESSLAGLGRVPSDLEAVGPAAAASSSTVGSRFAFVTLLTRDSYLPGVQALARSLAAVQTAHPLLVMYTADTLSPSAVAALQQEPVCRPLAVERYSPPGGHNPGRYKLWLYAECWTKLRMWELEHWDRLVYLDADMLVVRSIDGLFDLPPGFYADQPSYFNAGMFIMSPCRAELRLFDSLLAAGAAPIGGYAEQDFLNWRYQGVWRPLPPAFNAQRGIRGHHPQLWDALWPQVSIIHYTDGKPWQEGHPDNERDADLVELWQQAE